MKNKYAWLVYNGNSINQNLNDLYNYYKQIAFDYSINIDFVKNTQIFSVMKDGEVSLKKARNLKKPDFVLFLDKDIFLAKTLEMCGYKVFNSSEVLNICDDKVLTYQYLSSKTNIKFPKTLIAPFIFNNCRENLDERFKFLDFVESEFTYPFIIKEAKGSFGEQVYLINNREELIFNKNKLGSIPHLYQEFIKSSFGKDVRTYVVGNEFITGMLRYSENSFKSNVNLGGKFKKINIGKDFINMSIEVSKALNSSFIGVDILFGEEGEPIFCEVNSNSHIKNVSNLTGVNVCGKIFEYILSNI